MNQVRTAVLLLEDGACFHGRPFGKIGTAAGEICYNTGMTGYQEVFTDPSYYGQVLIMNNVHIGNYGVNDYDVESDTVKIEGLIGRNLEDLYSRKQANGSLQDYLKQNNVVGIGGIDTRALVTYIRNKGAMNCIISSEINELDELNTLLKKVPSMSGLELASKVTTLSPYEMGDTDSVIRISVVDFGIKRNILRCITNRGAFVKVFPANSTISDLKSFNPDGYFISNGPGDPSVMPHAIQLVKGIIEENKPVFGICLGHQLIALANNIPTHKLHHGHRGLNHPVKNLITGICEITTQNHGFGVDKNALTTDSKLEITHVNLNDGSIEGFRMKNKPVFSVQYHPESFPGPHDSRYLFDDFIQQVKQHKS